MVENTHGATETETASWTDPVTTTATDTVRCVEDGLGSVGSEIWGFFHQHPKVGGLVTGGLGLGAAMAIGVAELAATVFTGYLGYRIFAYGETLTEAFEKSIKLEEGKLPEKDM